MKKLFVSICAAFAMFAMVSCGGSSNPAIKAAEEFLSNPTMENSMKVEEASEGLTEEQKQEFEKWAEDNQEELIKAAAELMGEMM